VVDGVLEVLSFIKWLHHEEVMGSEHNNYLLQADGPEGHLIQRSVFHAGAP